jgi:membrane-associated phospholipid phosphatase
VSSFDAIGDRLFEPLRNNRATVALFGAASTVGDFSIVWHTIGLLAATTSRMTLPEALALSIALGFESLVVNQGIKRIFRRARPTVSGDHRFEVRTPRTSSFPSGHASSATFAAIVLTSFCGWPLAALWFGVAVIVATSRVVVRIHHLSDIVGGIITGAALAIAAVPLITRVVG